MAEMDVHVIVTSILNKFEHPMFTFHNARESIICCQGYWYILELMHRKINVLLMDRIIG